MADIPGRAKEMLGLEDMGVGGREGEESGLERLESGRGRGTGRLEMWPELHECSQSLRTFVAYFLKCFTFRSDFLFESGKAQR